MTSSPSSTAPNDGCSGKPYDCDGDGYVSDAEENGIDCNDADPQTHPGAPEQWYDGIDQACDGGDDYDADGDGHSATGWGDDCDDADPNIHPETPEICDDGLDNNCEPLDCFPDETSSSVSGQSGSLFGFSVAGLDFDGNETKRVYVGGPDYYKMSTGQGGVFRLEDAEEGAAVSVDIGARSGDGYGYSMAALPDAAGCENLVVGAPSADRLLSFEEVQCDVGNVEVYFCSGSEAGESTYWGTLNGDGAGGSLAALGEGTLGVGSPGAGRIDLLTVAKGVEALVQDSAHATFSGKANLGSHLSGAADVDGDGLKDLVFSADGGDVHVGLAPFTGNISVEDADVVFVNPDPAAAIGALDGKDLDQDGHAEILWTTPQVGAGIVYADSALGVATMPFEEADFILNGDDPEDQFGAAIAAGEVYLDTAESGPELIVGAPGHDLDWGDEGVVYLIPGGFGLGSFNITALQETVRVDGRDIGGGFGEVLSVSHLDGGDKPATTLVGVPLKDDLFFIEGARE